MFRFFRSTRQTLLNENKTLKYMKYAVGEVVLIMVGIFLALQLNNWNKGRKQEQDRQELIENLKADFQANLILLEDTVQLAEGIIEKMQRFLALSAGENNHLSIAEIKLLGKGAYSGFRYQPALPSYEAAVATGLIALIRSSTLNRLFIQFEQSSSTFNTFTELSAQEASMGSGREIRKQLGSWGVLFTDKKFPAPQTFELSDQEYRKMIAQKEIYSMYESMLNFHLLKFEALFDSKQTTEEILIALEAL